ncbi:MAG TPA: LamG domain-containing protein [Sedimentisphaerales bacterium]|nr:LamG domain-containing protein [Sedimentisphaerales bacterium]
MCKKLVYVAFSVFCLSLIPTNTANADLVGWWRLDEGSGITINDSSGNDHHGTVQGTPVWGFGPEGFSGALGFSETTGAYCGVFDPTGGTGTFTLTLWCLWDGTQSIQHFLTKSNGWGATTAMFQIEVKGGHSDPARVDRLHLAYQGAPQAVLNLVPHNEWVHLALVFDGTHATGYLNGVDDVGPQPTGIGPNVDAPIIIGASHTAEGRTFQGFLDDVRIFNEALPAGQIQAIMQGGGATYPFAYGPDPADSDLLADTWTNLSWRAGDFTVSHDVYIGDNLDDVNAGAESTFQGNQAETFLVVGFPGFPIPDGLAPGTTYYWRIDEVNDTEPNSPWKGEVWSFSIPPRTAYFSVPADSAESVDLDVELRWTAGYGAKLHTVYFGDNFDEVNNAAGGLPQGTATYTPGTLKLAKTYYWRVDEFDAVETYKGDVWSFTIEGGVGSPNPSNGAVDIKQTPILTWTPGVYAASHQVYFGTDKEAVRNADTGSPEYKGTRDLGAQSYDPGMLEWDTAYYWRIDEVNNTNPDSPWTGILWSFTTANFLIVDDFESYNDIDPPDPQSNRIFEAWLDGYGIPTNGALVGNDLPPYAEQTIVHSGIQSIPYFYDNSVGYSEATLTLTYPRDWTEKGVNKLTIWFRGDSANAAETLYVALNGSAVVNHDNPNAAQITTWTEWNIDLQAFADQGVNLANVNTIALGLGNKTNPQAGGSGTMYFDDIRLYPSAP